ncbi:hypothetical protein [Thermomonospora catenispora]|uniref:hypothetical protein n=1 Tax=Thermomonospora catenispora TaxID=2493090 RepID=UPI00112019B9|nr:hypothetical protein [Thermomonospora catenispora]TNY35741.1 hypothetical protein EIO00_16655 [Thermomonospora catenispora]
MSDHRRSHAPVDGEAGRLARLLVLALGLLGFVMLPGAGLSSAGLGIGIRTGAAQQPPAHQTGRGRAAAAPTASAAGQVVEEAQVWAAPPPHAAALADLALPAHEAGPPAPASSGLAVVEHGPLVASSVRTAPPRGRAPPVSTGL